MTPVVECKGGTTRRYQTLSASEGIIARCEHGGLNTTQSSRVVLEAQDVVVEKSGAQETLSVQVVHGGRVGGK